MLKKKRTQKARSAKTEDGHFGMIERMGFSCQRTDIFQMF